MRIILIKEICKEKPNSSALCGFNSAFRQLSNSNGLGTPTQRVKNDIEELSMIVNGQSILPKSKRLDKETLKVYKNKLSGLKAWVSKLI